MIRGTEITSKGRVYRGKRFLPEDKKMISREKKRENERRAK